MNDKRGARMETSAADTRPRRVSRIPRALPAAEHQADVPATVSGAVSVPIEQVERDPDQPRRDWRHAEGYQRLDELTQSIKEFGLLQPLVVRRVADHYVVIAGGRRLVAARRAGLREVPVIVRDDEGARVRVLQLIENLQRQQLAPLDEARAYQEMLEIDALTTGSLAARLHVSTQRCATSCASCATRCWPTRSSAGRLPRPWRVRSTSCPTTSRRSCASASRRVRNFKCSTSTRFGHNWPRPGS